MISVVTLPTGQLVTVAGQAVMVYTLVVTMVEVRVTGADDAGRMLPTEVVALDDKTTEAVLDLTTEGLADPAALVVVELAAATETELEAATVLVAVVEAAATIDEPLLEEVEEAELDEEDVLEAAALDELVLEAAALDEVVVEETAEEVEVVLTEVLVLVLVLVAIELEVEVLEAVGLQAPGAEGTASAPVVMDSRLQPQLAAWARWMFWLSWSKTA